MSRSWRDSGYVLNNLLRVKEAFDLTYGQFAVLVALVVHDCPDPRHGGSKKGVVWPSPRALGEMTGMSERNLRRVLDQLEAKGIITCLNPEEAQGGQGKVLRWRINYEAMGWVGYRAPRSVNPDIVSGLNPDTMSGESGNPNPEKNLPPPSPPPSSLPVVSTAVPPVLEEEEEFPFLSPDERTCLGALQVSPALWQRVRQSEPGTLQVALQHLLSRKEDILSTGHSLEERFGGLLTGRFVPSPEPEPLREEVSSDPWCLCQTCGVTYQGEHQCSSLPEGREPAGEGDLWLQEMKERAERAQREARE